MRTAIWIPPSLCECRIQITAEWPNINDVVEGIAYRHPIPFTIIRLALLHVCPEHLSYSQVMPDTSWFFDDDQLTGKPKQNRGYLEYPIDNPSPAVMLYTHFAEHKGQVHGYPCGCRTFQHIDSDGNVNYKEDSLHNQKCFKHKKDTLNMLQAKQDFDSLAVTDK